MGCPKLLPSWKLVRKDQQSCAYQLNVFLYALLGMVVFRQLSVIVYSVSAPSTSTVEKTPWGNMPWLTVCADRNTNNSIKYLEAIAVEGFGKGATLGSGNQMSTACTSQDKTAHYEMFNGTPMNGSNGTCQQLDLTSLVAEFDLNTQVNNVAVGGIVMRNGTSVEPKFVSVIATKERLTLDQWEKTFAPVLFVNPMNFTFLFNDPDAMLTQRVEAPIFTLEKRVFPNYTHQTQLTWFQSLKEQFPVFAVHTTKYVANMMGHWRTCLPTAAMTPEVIGDFLAVPDHTVPVFSFGLFIVNPTYPETSFDTQLVQILSMIGYLGGLTFVAHGVFFCMFTKPPKEEEAATTSSTTSHPPPLVMRFPTFDVSGCCDGCCEFFLFRVCHRADAREAPFTMNEAPLMAPEISSLPY